MRIVVLLSAALLATLSAAQSPKTKPGSPDPPKKDVPYILHADNLVETNVGEARQESRKDEQVFTIPGPGATAKTPLAAPEFLLNAEAIAPDRLQLYKLESKNGRREVVVTRKKKPVAKPARITVFLLHDRVFRIRVDDSLTPGEYALSPDGSNAVFCFAVE